MTRAGGVTIALRAELAQFSSDMRQAVNITNQSVNRISSQLATVGRAGAALGAAFALKGVAQDVIRTADSYNKLTARLKVATAATGDFNRVYQQLSMISRRNGADLEDSISLFQALNRSASELGASTTQMTRLTDIVQKLGAVSGAGPQQMSDGLRQLSQAMNSGIVHAEEWNSIVENIPEVANQAAAGMGVTIGHLRQMVIDQKLASEDLFKSILSRGAEADKMFASMPPTVERAWKTLTSVFTQLIGNLDTTLGSTQALAAGLEKLAETAVQMEPKMLQFGRTLKGVWTGLTGEFEIWRKSIQMDGMGLSWDENQKRVEQMRAKLREKIMYDAYDFGTDIHGPQQPKPERIPTPHVDKEAERKLKRELDHIKSILEKRREERRELELKQQGLDEIQVRYKQEQEAIERSTVSTKEKAAALKQLAADYAVIAQKTKELKAREDQKKAKEEAKELQTRIKDTLADLDKELDGRKKLTEYLQLEHELKKLIATGNKGSKEVAGLHEQLRRDVLAVRDKEALTEAKKAWDKLNESATQYKETLFNITNNLQLQNGDLEQRLAGEEKYSQFHKARREVEEQTADAIEKKKKILEEIQAIEAESPNNNAVAEYRKKIEQDITLTLQQRTQALEDIAKHEKRYKELNKQLDQQKQILKDITSSTGTYKDKVRALDDAWDRGWITAEQYHDALQQISKTQKTAADSAKVWASTLVGSLDRAIFSGGKLTDIFKNLGKEIAQLAAKKLLLDPLERKLTDIFTKIAGGGTPTAPSGYGPLGPQQPLTSGGVGPGQSFPSYGIPWAGPTTLPGYYQTGSGGGGGLLGLNFGGMSLGDWMEQFQWGGKGWGGLFNGLYSGMNPLTLALGGGAGFFGSLFNKGFTSLGLGTGSGGLLGSMLKFLPRFETGGYLPGGGWGVAGLYGPELLRAPAGGMYIQPGIRNGGPVARSLTESLMIGQSNMDRDWRLGSAMAREPSWQERNQIMYNYWDAFGLEGTRAAQQGLSRGWNSSDIQALKSTFLSRSQQGANPFVNTPIPDPRALYYMGIQDRVDPGVIKWIQQMQNQTGNRVENLGIWQLSSSGGGGMDGGGGWDELITRLHPEVRESNWALPGGVNPLYIRGEGGAISFVNGMRQDGSLITRGYNSGATAFNTPYGQGFDFSGGTRYVPDIQINRGTATLMGPGGMSVGDNDGPGGARINGMGPFGPRSMDIMRGGMSQYTGSDWYATSSPSWGIPWAGPTFLDLPALRPIQEAINNATPAAVQAKLHAFGQGLGLLNSLPHPGNRWNLGLQVLQGKWGGMKLFDRGGKFKKDEPFAAGGKGLELIWPETAGKVVSNSDLKQAFGGGTPKVEIINQTRGNIDEASVTIDPNGVIKAVLRALPSQIRRNGDVRQALKDVARGVT